tara:strand:+ start:410 stop:520 length:111 start_codon:yes stop_codon:yes gene_type:complete
MNKFQKDIEKAEYVLLIILGIVSFSMVAYIVSALFI